MHDMYIKEGAEKYLFLSAWDFWRDSACYHMQKKCIKDPVAGCFILSLPVLWNEVFVKPIYKKIIVITKVDFKIEKKSEKFENYTNQVKQISKSLLCVTLTTLTSME